jgi:hypothetical protein
MDIVGSLSAQLKLEENSAAGLAGALLLLVEDLARERINYAVAGQIRDAVPELRDWQTSAPTIAPGMLSLSSLPPATAPGDEGELAAVLSRFGIAPAQAGVAASLTSQFLASRLDPALLGSVVAAIPLLRS